MAKIIFFLLLLFLPKKVLAVDILSGHSPTCSSTYSGFSCSSVKDDNNTTFWVANGETDQWVSFDLGEDGSISGHTLIWQEYSGVDRVTNYKVQGSANNSDWTDIYTGNTASATCDEGSPAKTCTSTESYTNSSNYRYFRILMDAYSGSGQVVAYEISMEEASSSPTPTPTGVPASPTPTGVVPTGTSLTYETVMTTEIKSINPGFSYNFVQPWVNSTVNAIPQNLVDRYDNESSTTYHTSDLGMVNLGDAEINNPMFISYFQPVQYPISIKVNLERDEIAQTNGTPWPFHITAGLHTQQSTATLAQFNVASTTNITTYNSDGEIADANINYNSGSWTGDANQRNLPQKVVGTLNEWNIIFYQDKTEFYLNGIKIDQKAMTNPDLSDINSVYFNYQYDDGGFWLKDIAIDQDQQLFEVLNNNEMYCDGLTGLGYYWCSFKAWMLKFWNEVVVKTLTQFVALFIPSVQSDEENAEMLEVFTEFQNPLDSNLTSVITKPLDMIESIATQTCTPLHLEIPFIDTDLNLPCPRTVLTQYFPEMLSFWDVVSTGLISYWVVVKLLAQSKSAFDPDESKLEVTNL